MDSRHVTNEQAQAISRWLEPTAMRLSRLRERMETRGFPPDDRLYLQVLAAFKVLANLNGMLSGYNDPCRHPPPLDDEHLH